MNCAVKKSLHATEQDRAQAQQQRQAVTQIDPARLVFLEESDATTEMTRRYSRAARGELTHDAAPAGHWRTLTLLAALSLQGLRVAMPIESPTDGDVFRAYMGQVLGPRLEPRRCCVVLDNLTAHKVAGVRSLFQARGAQLLYLPLYSSDFNPIEQACSKIKERLRAAKPRTVLLLDAAVTLARAAVTLDNATGWFRRGYRTYEL